MKYFFMKPVVIVNDLYSFLYITYEITVIGLKYIYKGQLNPIICNELSRLTWVKQVVSMLTL